MVINLLSGLPVIGTDTGCQHKKVAPKYLDKDFKGLSAEEIHKRFPRFEGICPDCGEHWILYSSFAHYIAGDW